MAGRNRGSAINLRSITPNTVTRTRSESPIHSNNNLFLDYLTEILNSRGRITNELLSKGLSIGRSLTDQFTKNPSFSIEFYLSMTALLNYLQEDDLDPTTLQKKASEAAKHLNSTKIEENLLRNFTDKVNLKVINTLKRVICNNEVLSTLFNSFIILFNQADKDMEKIPLKRLQPSKVTEIMHKYLQTPGKMIQLCRKFTDFVSTQLITEANIVFAEDLLSHIDKSDLSVLDRTGGVCIFYDFLKACIDFSLNLNQDLHPSKISLINSSSQDYFENPGFSTKNSSKFIPLEEAVELSKELLKQSSRTMTPVKLSSSHLLTSYFQAKFQKYLSENSAAETQNYEARVLLYDQFERSILSEIRDKFVPRVVNLDSFEEELSNL